MVEQATSAEMAGSGAPDALAAARCIEILHWIGPGASLRVDGPSTGGPDRSAKIEVEDGRR